MLIDLTADQVSHMLVVLSRDANRTDDPRTHELIAVVHKEKDANDAAVAKFMRDIGADELLEVK